MKIYVVDVDSGNLQSLSNALEKLGYLDVTFIKTKHEAIEAVRNADRLILPGVGNFGHFMDQINSLDLTEPIMKYIATGKPIMGICVGLQAFFRGSVESSSSKGFGIIDMTLSKFNDSTKAVPHIGWNNNIYGSQGDKTLYGIDFAKKFYFVHSYGAMCAKDDQQLHNLSSLGWEYCLTKYEDESFIAALSKNNLFMTQFHPEKSGHAGLHVIDCFLKQEKYSTITSSNSISGLTKRVIACLDVRTNDNGDLVVTKGDQYDVRERNEDGSKVRNLGKPVQVAEKYYQQGADEVVFLNITSFRDSPLQDLPMIEVLKQTSKTVFVPLTIGGGIRDIVDTETGKVQYSALEVASMYFKSGADKVSIGSDAVYTALNYYNNGRKGDGTSPIETISKPYGSQAVVVSVDPKRAYAKSPTDVKHHTFKTSIPGPSGEEYVWYQVTVKGGRETVDLGAYELVQAVEALGAGEILLNCIDKDGTNNGYDLELIRDIKSAVKIPVISSSGAGNPTHFVQVFEKTRTDAALGAGMFHRNEYTVEQVKQCLRENGVNVRL